ncbi:hypothetical protein [Lacticaseibacillus saniviri]
MMIGDLINPLMPTLMMSLHPENVAAIKQGHKQIEYRKRFFKDAFQAFVCTTGKNGGIELFIKCDTAIQADAEKLAQIGMTVQQDDYHELVDYFQPSGGLAIPILRMATVEMIPRVTMQAQFDRFSVPQGYYFLDTREKMPLLSMLSAQEIQAQHTFPWADNYAAIAAIK